jgi:hypothetical protein
MGCGSSFPAEITPTPVAFAPDLNVTHPLPTIPLLQKEIEDDLIRDYSIAGLGNYLQTLGYY